MLDSCSEVSNINKETINTTSSLYAHKLWRLKMIKNLQKTGTLQEARTLNVQIAQMTNFCFPKTWSHCHQKLWMKIENFKIHHKGNTHHTPSWILYKNLGDLLEIYSPDVVFLYLGVSKNRGTPKWMVYKGKPY